MLYVSSSRMPRHLGVEHMKKLIGMMCVAALAACGGSGSLTNGADASAYRSAALQVSTSVASYDTATTSMTTPAECTAAVQHHEAQVDPVLGHMGEMAGGMDGAMRSMGEMKGADMECGVAVMQQEMQKHHAAACSSLDMAANRAEAQRHVEAMQQLANHMQMRAEEMSTLAAGGAMHGGTMQGGGWTTPDGGMMSWDDPMPGCAFVNGSFQQSGSTTAVGSGSMGGAGMPSGTGTSTVGGMMDGTQQ